MRRTLQTLLIGSTLVSSAFAGTTPHVTARPEARITAKIDVTQRAAVPNSHPLRVEQLADAGRLPASTPMAHLHLVLKGSDAQEYALGSLLDQQQDKSSANYHQWMTPETFGAAFGVADSDIAQVTAWLRSNGFTIETVTKSKRLIDFSGTAGDVEAAFGTEMHRYMLDGEMHSSNSTDISIPAALASVVAGPASLNDFRYKASIVNPRKVTLGKDGSTLETPAGKTSGVTPMYTSGSSGKHYLGAADLATVYNTNPLLSAGINGKGQTIGVVGQTDILLSDVQIYRRMFNLPQNDPTFTVIGTDPGTIADDGESDLDVELSGGIAPMANIIFGTSGNSYDGGGIFSPMEYFIEQNNVDIISLSYGGCEYNQGGNNGFINFVWEQAASQGQTAFVSAGDSGPATCDSSNNPYATQGYAVNGLGSTPYNVAVGGTMLGEGTALGPLPPYWGPATTLMPPFSTALGYIPELPWNESYFDPYGPNSGFGGIVSGGSGISIEYLKPAFQAGPGVPTTDPIVVPHQTGTGPHRYLPDVSLEAAGVHDGTIYCSEGSCAFNSDGTIAGIGAVGGTSVAAPSFAGVQALVNQKNGGRQGNANYYYYRLAAAQSTTTCNAANYVIGTATASCSFHDIQTGNILIPTNPSDTTSIGFTAAAGYDLTVGLGSPDVFNMATNWKTVTFNATTTTLALTPVTGAHGSTQTVNITVAPVSGTGAPTGDIAIIASAASGGVGFYTLTAANNGKIVNGVLTGLPSGTYNVVARYAGDTTYASSTSAPISVTITQDSTTTVAEATYLLSTGGGLTATSTFPYGSNVYVKAGITDTSVTGTPTGTITYNLTGPVTASVKVGVDPNGTTIGTTYYPGGTYIDFGLGFAGYDIMKTGNVLPIGTYTVTAVYSGDATFAAATSPVATFVVGQATPSITQRLPTEVASAQTFSGAAYVSTISQTAGGVPATGTMTITDTTTATVLASGPLSTFTSGATLTGMFTYTSNKLVTTGAHSIVATYSGDTNYAAGTSAATTVTVGGTATTTTIVPSVATTQVLAPVTFTFTVTGLPPAILNGTIYIFDGGNYLSGCNLGSTHTCTYVTTSLVAGTHNLTAEYLGSTTSPGYDASTSTVLPFVVTKNTPTVQLTTQTQNAATNGVSMNATLKLSPLNLNTTQTAYITATPPPTGNIQFLDGTTVLGTAPVTYLPGGYYNYVASFTTAALAPGPHSLTAFYPGDANYASSTSNGQTVNIGLTTLAITTYPTAPVYAGTAPFTLSATVTPIVPSSIPVGGNVKFYDGTTLIGTANVGANNVATTTTAADPFLGTRTITAVYSGDSNYYTSTTTTSVIITTIQPLVTGLSVTPNPLYIVRGTAGLATIVATSLGQYAGTITYSCSGLPAYTTCVFGTNPATFTAAGTANQSTALSIVTSPLTPINSGGFLWIPALLLAGFLAIRRKQLGRGSRQFLAFAAILFGAMSLTGCGGKVIPHVGVQNGSPLGGTAVTITGVAVGGSSTYANATLTTTLNVIITAQ